MFFLLNNIPGLGREYTLDSVGNTRYEIRMTIAANPLAGQLDGDSQVSLNLPTAPYVAELESE